MALKTTPILPSAQKEYDCANLFAAFCVYSVMRHFTLLLPVFILLQTQPVGAKGDSEFSKYPLHGVSRNVPGEGRVQCPDVDLVRYSGTEFSYQKPGRFHPAFVERLKRFEKVVSETAIEFYGRKPTKLVHLGTYNCRRIRAYPTWISEHGLGNAIDVAGFDFGKAPKGTEVKHRRLKRAFKVRILKNWKGRSKVGKIHSAFLQTLAKRLIERKDVFHVLLGPAFPGHKNHFHFDCSIFRMEHIFTPL